MKQIYWNNTYFSGPPITNNAEDNNPPLILSADFIINQDNFWNFSYNTIPSTMIKAWKYLHRFYFVIWIIRREKALKEIKEFVKANSLPLHAIYFIKNKRKYINSFLPLQEKIEATFEDKNMIML